MSSVIFTDQHAPDGRTIRYNTDESTPDVAVRFARARQNDELLEISNEDGGNPIFVNPDHVATVSPAKED